jgi:hypothetical protein
MVAACTGDLSSALGALMNWESEFAAQWQMFMNIVQTRVRRDCIDAGHYDLASINAIIESERSKWLNSSHPNGVWLSKLRRRHEPIGSPFQATLQAVRLDSPLALVESGFPWLWSAIVVALGTLTFLALRVLEFTIWQQSAAAVIVVVSSTSGFKTWLSNRRRQTIDQAISRLRTSLESVGSQLCSMVRQADQMELSTPSTVMQPETPGF